MNKIPKTYTTTQLQRQAGIYDDLSQENEGVMILRESQPIGVFTPVDVYNSMVDRIKELEEEIAVREVLEADAEAKRIGYENLQDADEFFDSLEKDLNKIDG